MEENSSTTALPETQEPEVKVPKARTDKKSKKKPNKKEEKKAKVFNPPKKEGTIAFAIWELITGTKLTNQEVLDKVKQKFGKKNTTSYACVAWYRSKLNKMPVKPKAKKSKKAKAPKGTHVETGSVEQQAAS